MSIIHTIRFHRQDYDLAIAATVKGVCQIRFCPKSFSQNIFDIPPEFETVHKKNDILVQFENELAEYLGGTTIQFLTPIDFLTGTSFQKSVWNKVKQIPYGHVQTYKQIAAKLNNLKAVRAVGAANGANPVPILVPCHRVVQSDGKLGGYAGGLEMKDKLLRLEGVLL